MMERPAPSDLSQLPLFGGLPEDALRAFAEAAQPLQIKTGEIVFREEEPARTLYVLVHGALDAVRKQVPLAPILPGESFGEMSFIDMQPRSATVRATESSTLWEWPYSAFHERYAKEPKVYTLLVMNIAREFSRRLRRADDLLVHRS
jgi:CRP-like cAMP-binding protein